MGKKNGAPNASKKAMFKSFKAIFKLSQKDQKQRTLFKSSIGGEPPTLRAANGLIYRKIGHNF